MPFKRERSPYYYVRRRNLIGYGDTGRLSSKSTSKRIARDMEHLLEEIAQRALLDPAWYDLLDAVCRRRTITLGQLQRARRTGGLEALKRGLHDPLITEVVAAFRRTAPSKKAIRVGLEQLVRLSPTGSRLSHLDGRTITEMCHRAEREGRKRNSVRRYLLRAISLLLRHHVGRAERDRIFDDVHFPAVDDTREVHLTPREIARLVQGCREVGCPELATIIRVALLTSADRGVLLSGTHQGRRYRGLLVRDLRIWRCDTTGALTGEVFLQDTKTNHRSRSVPLTDNLCRELLPQVKMKSPDDPVFDLSYNQLDYAWKRARKAVALDHVRFKDLRAQISIYGEEAGVPLTVLARSMGHRDEKMTRRYQQRATALSAEQAEAIEHAMFVGAMFAGEAPEVVPDGDLRPGEPRKTG